LPFAGLGVPINPAAHLGSASVSTFTDAKDINLMPNIDVVTPVSSAPSDRLALGVGWVRPGVGSIDGTLNPSNPKTGNLFTIVICGCCAACFEGNEE